MATSNILYTCATQLYGGLHALSDIGLSSTLSQARHPSHELKSVGSRGCLVQQVCLITLHTSIPFSDSKSYHKATQSVCEASSILSEGGCSSPIRATSALCKQQETTSCSAKTYVRHLYIYKLLYMDTVLTCPYFANLVQMHHSADCVETSEGSLYILGIIPCTVHL